MRSGNARPRTKDRRGRTVALVVALILAVLGIAAVSLFIENQVPSAPATDSESSSPSVSQDANETVDRVPALPRLADATDTLEPDTGEPHATESMEPRVGAAKDPGPNPSPKPTEEEATVALPVSEPDSERMITGVLLDAESNPVEGYVTFDRARQTFAVEPASTFAVPAPDRALPQGVIGHAWDISGQLERRFLWPGSDPDEEMTIVLEPHASVVGQLVDTQRRPTSSARLDLQTQMLDGAWRGAEEYLETPAVDEEGYFVFDKVAIGLKLRVTAHHGTLSGRSRQISLTAGQVVDAGEIVMTGLRPGAGLVQGRLIDETGRPLADRAVNVRVGRSSQWLRTDAEGYYVMTDMPTDRSITIVIEVDSYGSWSRATTPDDFACDFRLCPQGWDVQGKEALPLFAGRWFNHAPMTLKEVKGRVVLLTFRDFAGDRDPGLSRLQNLHSQYGRKGLLIIAVYNHLPQGGSLAGDLVVNHLAASFGDASIAGFLDGDPALVADLMPPERPAGAAAGATRWLYQVHSQPAFFLIDKAGKVRHCAGDAGRLNGWIESLLDE